MRDLATQPCQAIPWHRRGPGKAFLSSCSAFERPPAPPASLSLRDPGMGLRPCTVCQPGTQATDSLRRHASKVVPTAGSGTGGLCGAPSSVAGCPSSSRVKGPPVSALIDACSF
jgi:hypothetical protein